MLDRWRLFAAGLVVCTAAALAVVASSHAAISIQSVTVQAGGANIPSATGPMGAGYDIRVVANVSSGDTWRATRWTSGGVSFCINHSDQGSGTSQAVTLPYAFQKGLLRETPLPADLPPGAGNAEHVFPPPPGPSQLTVAVYNTNDCSGSPSSTQSITLTTTAPAANPPLIAACQELKVAVVLDESGSIASAGATQKVRDATKALAQGLVGTGASMAAFKFSTTRNSSTIAPYQTVTQAFVNGTLTNYLNNYNPSGYTNWDDGLLQVEQATASNKADLIIFLTDGNPNRYGNGSVTGIQEGEYRAMNPAAEVADRLKQAGSHMFVIGMGDGVTDPLSALRLQAVSGDRSFPTYPISIADYTLVTNFDELAAALAQLSSNLCNVTVTVTKETDEERRDAWVSKPGWTFSGRVEAPPGQFAYRWFEPNAVNPVTPGTATQSGITGPDGILEFVWRPTSAASLSNITISETVPSAYTAKSVTCVSGGTIIVESEVPATVMSFTLTGLRVRDRVECVVRNRFKRSTVRVVKKWEGEPASATIFVDRDGSSPYDASKVATASGDSVSFDYPVSTAVTVGETAVPSGYSATIDCGQGPQAYSGGPFPVTSPANDGGVLTCTITNKQLLSTVRVVKQWVGASASTTIFVDRDGTEPFDASTVATTSGDSASYTYPVSTPVTVGETPVPAGYGATIHCGPTREAPQPYPGGPFHVTAPPTPGATLTCTITNKQQFSTVQVIKQWVGTPDSTTIFVDQDGVGPPFDAQTVATASGDSASATYPVSTPVFVGEFPVPTGYTATIDCGDGPVPFTGAPFPVTSPATDGATLICTISNVEPPPPPESTVRIVKSWIGDPASTTIFVDLDGVGPPFDAETITPADGDSASASYPIGTQITVGETPVPAGFAATIHCGPTREAPRPYTGPITVTAPTTPGATLTCTITNTQLLSTVQVVKNWVGTPSSATIFVDVDGAAPYQASTVATTSGASASFTYPVSTPTTVGETAVPTGFTATIDCGEGPQAYSGGPFPVTSPDIGGATLTCTITNAQQRSTVQVVKQWAGAASTATIFVDSDGTSPYDASIVATANGASTSFTYPVSTGVTVGETAVPTGYTATIDCSGGPQPYTGGPFPVTSPAVDGATLTCTITNTPQATVRVLKNWVGRPTSATIFVDRTGQMPFDVSTIAQADGESASFDYPLSTQVTLGEIAVPRGFVSIINCGTGPRNLRRYAGGPFTVTSPATPNTVVTCTVTNVRRPVPGRLVIVKTSSQKVIRSPRRFMFRFTVRNTGRGVARAVRVCDPLPNGLVLTRGYGARLERGQLCWHITRLRPGRSKKLRVLVRAKKVNRPTVIVNLAEVGGLNTPNCPRIRLVRRAQNAACRDRASVRLLPPIRVVRPPFTG